MMNLSPVSERIMIKIANKGTAYEKDLVIKCRQERINIINREIENDQFKADSKYCSTEIVKHLIEFFNYKPDVPIQTDIQNIIQNPPWIVQDVKTYGDIGIALANKISPIKGIIINDISQWLNVLDRAKILVDHFEQYQVLERYFERIKVCIAAVNRPQITTDYESQLKTHLAILQANYTLDNGMLCFTLEKIRANHRKAVVSLILTIALGVITIVHEYASSKEISLWIGIVLGAIWATIDYWLQHALNFEPKGLRFDIAKKLGYIPHHATRDVHELTNPKFEEIF